MVVHMLILITRLLYSLKGIQGRRNMGGRGGAVAALIILPKIILCLNKAAMECFNGKMCSFER